jgi:hypothetical protein
MAFGTATTSLLSGGSAYRNFNITDLPTNMPLNVMVSWTTAHNFAVSGGVDGPAAITIAARTYGAPFNQWTPWTTNANYLGTNLGQEMDYGALDMDSHEAGPGMQTFVTLTLHIPVMPLGSYPIYITDGEPYGPFHGTGFWASEDPPSNGNPVDWDQVTGFMLNITPEPASMLLLAGALPFLRRRTA